jgi:hypothetical protein
MMSFSIFDRGDGRFRLVRDEREVGWVEDRTIGFRGFADADEARAAATTAHTALARWIARQVRTEPVPPRRRRLSTRREGAVEWLTLGGVRVGRLWRFAPDDLPETAPKFGFEVYLPARVAGGLALSAAQVMGRALDVHSLAPPDSEVRRQARAAQHSRGTAPDLTAAGQPPPAA